MKDKIYRLAPYFAKVLMLNIMATVNYRNRYTNQYKKYVRLYNKLWTEDRSLVLDFQKTELISLLKECYTYSPFYESRFKENKIELNEIIETPYSVLKRMPILTKMERKKHVEAIVNLNPERKISEIGYTSGTSGSPTKNVLDAESVAKGFALWARFHKTIGIDPSSRNVRFSGRLIVNPLRKKPPFWVYNRIEQQLFMSSYHLADSNLKSYINKLNRFEPELLDGYPSAIYVIARYINRQEIKLSFKPKAIATTAETLYDYQRTEIEKAFNCKVFNQYASSEGSPFITECKMGNLHINEDSGYFEFLDDRNEPALPSQIGRMVVTSFRNLKTPLIRYDIEDTILLPKNNDSCGCGCHMPYVEKIIGREDDVLWTEEKGYIGRMDTAYKGLEGIVKSQLIQETKYLLIVKNIIDEDYTEQMNAKFIQNLKDRVGSKVIIKIEIVDDIPLGPNGKFDAVKRQFNINE